MWRGRGSLGGKGGVKNFFPYPNELILAYSENLVEIGLLVEAVDELCGRGQEGRGRNGTAQRDSIDIRQPQPKHMTFGLAWLSFS